eukprot:1399439-Pleurochrysis_carterae.AAC.2
MEGVRGWGGIGGWRGEAEDSAEGPELGSKRTGAVSGVSGERACGAAARAPPTHARARRARARHVRVQRALALACACGACAPLRWTCPTLASWRPAYAAAPTSNQSNHARQMTRSRPPLRSPPCRAHATAARRPLAHPRAHPTRAAWPMYPQCPQCPQNPLYLPPFFFPLLVALLAALALAWRLPSCGTTRCRFGSCTPPATWVSSAASSALTTGSPSASVLRLRFFGSGASSLAGCPACASPRALLSTRFFSEPSSSRFFSEPIGSRPPSARLSALPSALTSSAFSSARVFASLDEALAPRTASAEQCATR